MTPEHEVHTHHHRSGHRTIDFLVPLSALAISLISLGVAIHHGHTMQEMADANTRLVAANSWPLLQYQTSNMNPSGHRAISMLIQNAGVGPAKVMWVEMSCGGLQIRNPDELLQRCGGFPASDDEVAHGIPRERLPARSVAIGGPLVLRPGESAEIISMQDLREYDALWQVLNVNIEQAKLKACYCSVFDECWISDLRTLMPNRVAQCPVSKEAFSYLR